MREAAPAEPVVEPVLPVSVPPEFWLPGPFNPGPVPAPSFMYFTAAAGMSGRASFETSQTSDEGGQVDADEVELAPPLPEGFGVLE